MKVLRELQDKQYELLFKKGKPLDFLFPLYEANDTFLFTPGEVTKGASHVRDGIDLKRMMVTVVASLGLCMVMAMYNTGYQASLAIAERVLLEMKFRPFLRHVETHAQGVCGAVLDNGFDDRPRAALRAGVIDNRADGLPGCDGFRRHLRLADLFDFRFHARQLRLTQGRLHFCGF